MAPEEPPRLSPLGHLALVLTLFSLAVVFLLHGYLLGRDLASGSILDPWLALFPVLWIDLALAVLLLFSWGLVFLRGQPASGDGRAARWRPWLIPDFGAMAEALASPLHRRWILGVGAIYAVLLMFLQRILVIEPTGTLLPQGVTYPLLEVFGGPVGWGPKLVWAPNPYFGILLRPYTLAVTILLSTLSGLGVGLVAYRWRARGHRRGLRGASGAAAGLLVMCPACTATPGFAFLVGLLTPAAGGGVASAGTASGPLAAFSTAMLLSSVALMWVGIARASRETEPTAAPPSPGAKHPYRWELGIGRLLMVLGIVLAVGVLLTDLAGAPPPTSSDHEGLGLAAPAHSPTAIGLAIAGPMVMLTGIILSHPNTLDSPRGIALLTGLTLLYVDGLLHWFAVLEHIDEAPSAAFFVGAGTVQILSTPIIIRRERLLWWISVGLTLFFIDFYVVTRLVPPPFSLEPESLESLGFLSKGLEAALLGAMAVFFGSRILPVRLRDGLARGPAFALIMLGIVTSDVTIGLETYWRFLPFPVFLLTALLLVALIVSVVMARIRANEVWAGLTWVMVALLLTGHAVHGSSYLTRFSLLPVLFCLTSLLLLGSAPIVSLLSRRWMPPRTTAAGWE